MTGEAREPGVRRPFRILAGLLAAFCFMLAAWLALGPDRRDAGLMPWLFSACGVVILGLALTGSAWRWGRPGGPFMGPLVKRRGGSGETPEVPG